ncbi:hypothetical protein FACS189473_0560 [Spirochaetia bacterium]|nr:hypothetical protein FACS189473_0560 [Spirochaetia bacterium]
MKNRFFRAGVSLFSILLSLFLSGCQPQTDPRDRPPLYTHTPDHPLIGTKWLWESAWGTRTLFFDTADTVIYQDQNEGTYTEPYIYDKDQKQGRIDIYGEFTVTGDYEALAFSNWKNYGHGSEYVRLVE